MLTRYDPFREMLTLNRRMDRLFNRFFDGEGNGKEWTWESALYVPLDVSESEDHYQVKASLPGVNPDDIEITYNDNSLTIQGEIKRDEETEDERYHVRERRYGSFMRTIQLPSHVDEAHIEASYESGELLLRLPKTEEAKPKRISVKSGSGKKMIEGELK